MVWLTRIAIAPQLVLAELCDERGAEGQSISSASLVAITSSMAAETFDAIPECKRGRRRWRRSGMLAVTMPDILAIVSKAIFEKEAKHLGLGDVWPTAAYVSTNAGLSPLALGGRLFLVTVRPEFELWLVAVLEQPQTSRGAWRAATNTRPITNLTRLIPRITFANGKGLVRDAKLGMSLQSPRELSAATSTLIGGAAAASTPASKTPAQADTNKPEIVGAKPSTRVARAPPAKSSSANTEPARSAGVPQEKRWNAATSNWELGETDEHGCRQGTWLSWREDGTKCGETPYVDHDIHGLDRRFHPDGTVASEGRWERGILHDQVFFATANPTDQLSVRQGGSVTVRTEFVSDASGRANASIRFFDKDGRQRDSSGALVPEERPAGVPETARWFSTGSIAAPDGSTAGWVDGQTTRERNLKRGVWRWWSKKGELLFTAVMTDTGKVLHRVKPGADEAEREIEAFVADPEDNASSVAGSWTPYLHERLRARLATAPPSLLREYIAILHEETEIHEHLWTHTISRPREIVELVEDWEARTPRNARDVEAWFIFGAGARSALELRDRERTERWWKRFLAIPTPTQKPENSSAVTSLVADFGKSGLVRKEIEAWLSGKAEKNHRAIATRLSTSKTFASVDDAELAELVSARAGARPCRVMVRDRKTCEAWLVDDDGQSHYWKGDVLERFEVAKKLR
jgi:hypothetical protein